MRHILLPLLMLFSTLISAQEELEEYYIPPANSIFEKNSESDDSKFESSRSYPDYSIRYIPTTLARNIISFEFEKSLSESISLGLVSGYCIGKSFIQTETIAVKDNQYSGNELTGHDILSSSSTNGGGLVVGAYFRIYVDTYYGNGDKFWELQYRHWSYGFDLDQIDNVEGNSEGRLSNNFIGIMWGVQSYGGKNDNFVMDSKIGMGLNIGQYDSFSYIEDYINFTGTYKKSSKDGFVLPMFYYSIALGYAKYSK